MPNRWSGFSGWLITALRCEKNVVNLCNGLEMKQKGFDASAKDYDDVFSSGFYATHARQNLYRMLGPVLKGKPISILELNAGTGVDALYFLKQGHRVFITDASEGMLKEARQKVNRDFSSRADIRQIDLRNYCGGAFQPDLVFSNFGGLNCLAPDELKRLFAELNKDLKPGNWVCLTIMPPHSLFESFYFLIRGKFNSAFRRRKSPVDLFVHNERIPTWYYSPNHLCSLFPSRWKIKKQIALGFFLPPPFLDGYSRRFSLVFGVFVALEKWVHKTPALASYADHYSLLIQVE